LRVSGGLHGFAGLAVAGLLLWAALWHSRLLVSGVYFSVWRLLWQGDVLPGLAALPLLLGGSLLASRSPRAAALLALAAAPGPLVFGDWAPGLAVSSALALSSLLAYAGRLFGPAPAILALALDGSARYLLGGLDPVETLAGSLALSAVTLLLAYPAASGLEPSPAAPWHGALLGFAVAGGGYPVSLARWAGGQVSGAWEAAALYLPAMAAAVSGLASPLAALTVSAASLGASHLLHPWLAAAAAGGLAARLRPSPWGAPGAVAAALLFSLAGFLHVAVYTGSYLGLPMFEGLYAAPLALSLAAALPGALRAGGGCVWGRGGVAGSLLAGALLLAAASQAPLAPDAPVGAGEGVASYNIHQGFTADGRLNGAELAGALSMLPAVLCLQEVDGGRATSSYIDVPVLLSSMGYRVEFQPAIAGHYGVAVAYRGGPLERLASGVLPGVDSEDRAWLAADAGGLPVATVHLGLTPGERLVQVELLFQGLEAAGVEPAVLCGDFNEEWGAATEAILSRGYVRLEPAGGPGFTCCLGEDVRVAIDHVYVLEGSPASLWEAWIVYVEASDHLPVAAGPR